MRPWCAGRGLTFVRTADAAVLRAQRTRSKDRRCFTVLCHHTTASRLFFPIADSESQRKEEKVGEDGSASFSVSAADETAVCLEEHRKRRDTDGWMRLSRDEMRGIPGTLERNLAKLKTWVQALEFTTGVSEQNASSQL